MFSFLKPHYRLPQVADIEIAWLAERGIRGLLVDLDSTLVDDHAMSCHPRAAAWVRAMRASGIALCIVSNSAQERVAAVAAGIDSTLPFICDAGKPKTTGFRAALRRLALPADAVAVVGDQLFTDILGGRLLGARTILVTPTASRRDQFWMTRWKRPLESWLLGD